MSGGFFGFNTELPGREAAPSGGGGGGGPAGTVHGFQARADADSFLGGPLGGAGEEEDLAVYQWGEGMDTGLLEGGDNFNDETFGDLGDFSQDFQFSSHPAPAPVQRQQARGPIASTKSHFHPKAQVDLFADTEDDFYSSRPAAKKSGKQSRKKEPEPLWAQASPANAWGAAPNQSGTPTQQPAPPPSRPPPGQILSLDEIEADLARTTVSAPAPVPASQQPHVLTLEEIESQMVAGTPPPGQPQQQQRPQGHQQHASIHAATPPQRSTPPVSAGLNGSGYTQQQALLDSMFPEIGSAPNQQQQPPAPGQQPPHPQQQQQMAPLPGQRQPSPEELAQMEEMHRRIASKIEAMSKHNNLMGNSDKDFITRIQLSQLATADPYSSDFYAQVYSALIRRQQVVDGQQAPSVVQVAPGLGFGVGAPTGNRFGKMGTASMQRLTTQVKKLVSTTAKRQQNQMSNDALQGALGRVRRGPSQVAPRQVLAIPATSKTKHQPINQLNQSTGVTRPALTRKQVMFALEELYDDVLEIEQMRRDAPPPTDVPSVEAWNEACTAKVDDMWRKLMVMEPLGVSNPHPFISLMNPPKGQRLFPRLLRHLPHQQSLTLLTLLIATYPQLDVVARAPPPPVADSSLLTKADRLDRARREAETDSFLHHVIPGVDAIINQCSLGLVSGLLGICSQRMEVWKVASTRPGVALFTALLSKAQSLVRGPQDPNQPETHQDPAELEQWHKMFAYFLQIILPHLPELFPSTQAQKVAFGPGAYLMGDAVGANQFNEKEGLEIERREAEVWGLGAALAVNAPEDQQTNLVAALREKILHTVQAARDPHTPRARAEMKLRNVNLFLHGLGLDASMIE